MNQDGGIVGSDMVNKYEQLVLEEDILIQRIATCEECVNAILAYILKNSQSIHLITAEDIINAVHLIGKDLQTELLHLRLEKSILAGKMELEHRFR
ncbi:hypothetical protein [Paenibacillus sp. MBLB4367]|uniref:hypothetical protein n=1 Tax=Paenibacillus sp. MBLB4367 TaxID=3384767 RepID=UPI003907FDF2